MIGIGIDAVDIDRLRGVLARRPGMTERLFTDHERACTQRSADCVPRLAARFAAKEAVMKALGVGIGAIDMHDVEVRSEVSGRPVLLITGRAAALAIDQGVTSWLVSLTHTEHTAQAVVAAL